MMRLAYLAHCYPYPSHTFIRREIRELERLGHEIHRFALRAAPTAILDAEDEMEGAQTWTVLRQPVWRFAAALLCDAFARPRRALRAWKAAYALAPVKRLRIIRALAYFLEASLLAREFRHRGLLHLHAHFGTHPSAVAHVASTICDTSYSLTIHGPEEFLPEFRSGIRAKVHKAAFTAVISDYCAARVRELSHHVDREKIVVVRCGVGPAFLGTPSPVDPQTRQVVCVGRLTARKGQLRLIDAATQLHREGTEFSIVMLGDGELRGEIEARIESLGLHGCIELRGWADESEVRSSISAARGLVVPSSDEGLPVAIVEALALGRPVIASRVAAIPELVRDGETGWLVSADGIDDLASALRDLLATPAQTLTQLGSNGRELVLRCHRTEIEVEILEGHFRRALTT